MNWLLPEHIERLERTLQTYPLAKAAYASSELRGRLSRHHQDVDSAFWGWNDVWLAPEFRAWSIEALLPPVLAQLSDEGKAILAEKRGLYLGTAGFAHEQSEELAALGADLATVQERHAQLLHGNMRLRGDGWGFMNAGGYSELGFWPLYFGDDYFILVVGGQPRFNQEAYTTLIWTLGVRYGGEA